mmetsp:Transcript_45958/g.139337  ORF Transcript_45958/g.139337 Transcript_45958/m.139337 type:complete len:482 (+) Transcript_45958:181-1626(+)
MQPIDARHLGCVREGQHAGVQEAEADIAEIQHRRVEREGGLHRVPPEGQGHRGGAALQVPFEDLAERAQVRGLKVHDDLALPAHGDGPVRRPEVEALPERGVSVVEPELNLDVALVQKLHLVTVGGFEEDVAHIELVVREGGLGPDTEALDHELPALLLPDAGQVGAAGIHEGVLRRKGTRARDLRLSPYPPREGLDPEDRIAEKHRVLLDALRDVPVLRVQGVADLGGPAHPQPLAVRVALLVRIVAEVSLLHIKELVGFLLSQLPMQLRPVLILRVDRREHPPAEIHGDIRIVPDREHALAVQAYVGVLDDKQRVRHRDPRIHGAAFHLRDGLQLAVLQVQVALVMPRALRREENADLASLALAQVPVRVRHAEGRHGAQQKLRGTVAYVPDVDGPLALVTHNTFVAEVDVVREIKKRRPSGRTDRHAELLALRGDDEVVRIIDPCVGLEPHDVRHLHAWRHLVARAAAGAGLGFSTLA